MHCQIKTGKWQCNMNRHGLMIMATAVLFGYNSNTFAQSSATGSATANIIVPIALVKNVDMNFGNAAVSSIAGGSIVLAPAGTRSASGVGVTLPTTAGTVAAASFTVSGAPSYTFAVTLPGSALISGPGVASMTVNGFTSIPSATGSLSSGGTQVLRVGATINVAAAQAPGSYTNATAIPVTVNYN
jgi:hypothetical protein